MESGVVKERKRVYSRLKERDGNKNLCETKEDRCVNNLENNKK